MLSCVHILCKFKMKCCLSESTLRPTYVTKHLSHFFLSFYTFPGVLCTSMCLRVRLCKLYLDRGQALVLAGWFSHKTFTTHTHTLTHSQTHTHGESQGFTACYSWCSWKPEHCSVLGRLAELGPWTGLLSVKGLVGQRLQHYQCHSVCSAPVHKSVHMRLM